MEIIRNMQKYLCTSVQHSVILYETMEYRDWLNIYIYMMEYYATRINKILKDIIRKKAHC